MPRHSAWEPLGQVISVPMVWRSRKILLTLSPVLIKNDTWRWPAVTSLTYIRLHHALTCHVTQRGNRGLVWRWRRNVLTQCLVQWPSSTHNITDCVIQHMTTWLPAAFSSLHTTTASAPIGSCRILFFYFIYVYLFVQYYLTAITGNTSTVPKPRMCSYRCCSVTYFISRQ